MKLLNNFLPGPQESIGVYRIGGVCFRGAPINPVKHGNTCRPNHGYLDQSRPLGPCLDMLRNSFTYFRGPDRRLLKQVQRGRCADICKLDSRLCSTLRFVLIFITDSRASKLSDKHVARWSLAAEALVLEQDSLFQNYQNQYP